MLDIIHIILLPLIGFFVALAVGLSGIGGAALVVPPLLFLRVPSHEVVGSVLAYSFLTKIFASLLHHRERNISFRAMGYLALGVVPAIFFATLTFLGIREALGPFILDVLIVLGIGVILVLVALSMIKSILSSRSTTDWGMLEAAEARVFSRKDRVALASSGFLVAYAMQLTSVGAGTLFVPLVLKVIRSPRLLAGTSVLYGLLVTALGGFVHFWIGNVSLPLVGMLLVGSIPGVYMGVRIATMAQPQTLSLIFNFLILGAGLLLIGQGTLQVLG